MSDPIAEIPAAALVEMINQTVFSISNEESRFTLNGALMVLKPESLTLVATDGHRLAMVEKPMNLGGTGVYRALLPKKAMTEILKLAGEAGDASFQFAATDNHLFFRLGQRLLISRKLTGNFPDYDRVLPKDHANSVTMSKEEMKATIERVAQFADDRSHAVRMQIGDGELTVHSSLSDTGESEGEIGEALKFSLDKQKDRHEPAFLYLF